MDEAPASYRRIAELKRRSALNPLTDPAVIGCAEHRAIAETILRQAVRVLHAPEGKALPAMDEKTLFFGLQQPAASYASDQLALCGPEWLAGHFGGTFGGLLLDEQTLRSCQGRTVVACLSPQPDLPQVLEQVRTLAASGAQVIAAAMATPIVWTSCRIPCGKPPSISTTNWALPGFRSFWKPADKRQTEPLFPCQGEQVAPFFAASPAFGNGIES